MPRARGEVTPLKDNPHSDLFPPGKPHFLKILRTPKVGPLASTELSKHEPVWEEFSFR